MWKMEQFTPMVARIIGGSTSGMPLVSDPLCALLLILCVSNACVLSYSLATTAKHSYKRISLTFLTFLTFPSYYYDDLGQLDSTSLHKALETLRH